MIRQCHEFGLRLWEVLALPEPLRYVTHRQFLMLDAWLEAEWNRPNRTDQYLIQIATEVRRGHAKSPRKVKHDHLRIRFVTRAKESLSPQQATRQATAWVLGMAGGKVPANAPPEMLPGYVPPADTSPLTGETI